MDEVVRDEKDVEADEKQLIEFRQLRRKYTELASLHKDARINMRDITDYEHIVFEEMLFDLFKRLEAVEALLKG